MSVRTWLRAFRKLGCGGSCPAPHGGVRRPPSQSHADDVTGILPSSFGHAPKIADDATFASPYARAYLAAVGDAGHRAQRAGNGSTR